MRNLKASKTLAAVLAATMVLSPATALASDTGDTGDTTPATGDVTDIDDASGELNGSGNFEGYVDKNVFRIVLPTVSNVDFSIDPQGLLGKADKDKYTLGEGAVYFTNAPTTDGDAATYSATSDAISFVNKSSYAIKVGLAVTLNTGDIAIAKSADIATATEPSLSLGLIEGSNAAVDIDSASFKSTATKVNGVPEKTDSAEGYEIKATAKDGGGYTYTYELSDSFDPDTAAKAEYKLTGKCNNVAGWGTIEDTAVTAKIAWTVTNATAPGISGTTYSRGSSTNTYALENITQEIKSIEVSTNGTTAAGALPSGAYSVNDDKTTLTIDGTKNTFIGAGGVGAVRYFIVTFADGSKITFSVNVSA